MCSGPPAWKQLIDCPPSVHEHISAINSVFSDCDEVEAVGRLSGDDAQTFIDLAYEVSLRPLSPLTPAEIMCPTDQHIDSLAPQIRWRCMRSLYEICGSQALLPKQLIVPLHYDRTESPQHRGRYADVWTIQHHGRTVALKVLKVSSSSNVERISGVGFPRSACIDELTCPA